MHAKKTKSNSALQVRNEIISKSTLSSDFTRRRPITMSHDYRTFKQAILRPLSNLSLTAQGRNLTLSNQSIKYYVLRMLFKLNCSLARTYTISDCFEQCRQGFISPTKSFRAFSNHNTWPTFKSPIAWSQRGKFHPHLYASNLEESHFVCVSICQKRVELLESSSGANHWLKSRTLSKIITL